MSDPVLEKRDNHCFISYASEDGALAQRIANWLGEAGLRIWFDQVRLGASAPVLDVLTRYRKESRRLCPPSPRGYFPDNCLDPNAFIGSVGPLLLV